MMRAAGLAPSGSARLTDEPRTNRARRSARLAIAIVEGIPVDETEDVGPFVVRSHHQMTARRERAPKWLVLVAGRIRALQMSGERIALLLRDDERCQATAPSFNLGDPIPLPSPCTDKRWRVSTECRFGEGNDDHQRTDQGFHLEPPRRVPWRFSTSEVSNTLPSGGNLLRPRPQRSTGASGPAWGDMPPP